MNLLVHMDARGTSSVYPHLGIMATYFTRWLWPGRRGATRLDDWLGPGRCFGLGYVVRLAPLLLQLGFGRGHAWVPPRPFPQRGIGQGQIKRGRCAPPAAIVSDRVPVRMTGLIAATSPLPESAAFHNGVTGRPAAAQRGLASARRNWLPGGVPRSRGVPATARFRAIIISA